MVRIVFVCLVLIISTTFLNAQLKVNNLNNVGVTQTNDNYKMSIYNDVMTHSFYVKNNFSATNLYGVFNQQEGTGTKIYGIYSRNHGSGNEKFGFYNEVDGFANSEKLYGIKNMFYGSSHSIKAIENVIHSNASTGTLTGIVNDLRGSASSKTGINNYLNGAVTGNSTGLVNSIYTTGYNKTGLKNLVTGSGTNEFNYGLSNHLSGSNKYQYNIYNSIAGSAEKKYGMYAYISGDADATYGVYNYLNSTELISTNATLQKAGVYNFIKERDAYSSRGIYNRIYDGTASGQTYGVDNYMRIDNGSGTSIATFNYMYVAPAVSSGNIYGSRNFISGSGSPSKAYGVYSYVNSGLNANESYAGYFIGGLYLDGSPLQGSDERLKEDIDNIESGLSKLKRLKPKKYKLKSEKKDRTKKDKLNYGFLAHEVMEIFPELVTQVSRPGEARKVVTKKAEIVKDSDGNEIEVPEEFHIEQEMDGEPMLAMDYNSLIAVLVSALQEQDEKIIALEERQNETEKTLKDCGCGKGKDKDGLQEDTGAFQNVTPVFLNNKLAVKIYPNPTNNDATLEINSEESGIHQIHVYDEQGRLVHEDEIYVSSGTHQHEIASHDWAGGLYYINTTYKGISKSLKLIVTGK